MCDSENFQLSAKVLGPQDLQLTLIGITGSKMSYGKYIATCWKSEDIGGQFDQNMSFEDEGESFTVNFPNLNMDEFPYNISFSVGGDIDSDEQNYYVASVSIPTGSAITGDVIQSIDPVKVTLGNQTGKKIRVNCSIPSDNNPQVFPQYVVLNKGGMSNSFNQTPVSSLTQYTKIDDIDNVIIEVSENLRIGDTYTIAYIMGDKHHKPDLDRVVAWTEFVAS